MSEDTENSSQSERLPDAGEFPQQYSILKKIGSGGMGEVYLAKDSLLDRTVIIKILQVTQNSEESRQRFLRETKVLSGMKHASIVQLYSGGISTGGRPYLVMEWLEGQTLESVINSKGKLSGQDLKIVFDQLLSAVEYAHSEGIIHRDLSAANIILVQSASNVVVKLLDFGLARSFLDDDPQNVKLTSTGKLIGNPSYMSPEQCKGTQLGPQSDIYAIGCILFYCLSGSQLFKADTPMEMMYKHLNESPDFSQLSIEVKRSGITDVLSKCLAKDPNDRFKNVSSLATALQSALSRYVAKPKSPAKVLGLIGAVSLLAVLAAGAISIVPKRQVESELAGQTGKKSSDTIYGTADKAWNQSQLSAAAPQKQLALIERSRKLYIEALDTANKELAEGATNKVRPYFIRYNAAKQIAACDERLLNPDMSKQYYKLALSYAANTKEPVFHRFQIAKYLTLMLKRFGRLPEAEEELRSALQEKPASNSLYLWNEYCTAKVKLAENQCSLQRYTESIKTAISCLDDMKRSGLIGSPYEALANAIIAYDYSRLGKLAESSNYFKKAMQILKAKGNDLGEQIDAAASTYAFAAQALWDGHREESKKLFEKGMQICLVDHVWQASYAGCLEKYSLLLLDANDAAAAEKLARASLKESSGFFQNDRVLPVCYMILSEADYLQGKDKECKIDVELGMKACAESQGTASDIAIVLTFVLARMEARQAKHLTGKAQAFTRDIALQLFKKSEGLLSMDEFKYRRFIIDGGKDYAELKSN